MRRRGFLGGLAGILAAGFAPAAAGSGVLMPIRSIVVPPAVLVPRSSRIKVTQHGGPDSISIAAFALAVRDGTLPRDAICEFAGRIAFPLEGFAA